MAEYWDYLFEDNETGEEFLVELNIAGMTREEGVVNAYQTALEETDFEDITFIRSLSPAEGEWLGLDAY